MYGIGQAGSWRPVRRRRTDVGVLNNPKDDPRSWRRISFDRFKADYEIAMKDLHDQDLAGFGPVSQKRGSEPSKDMNTLIGEEKSEKNTLWAR